jgi:hypothetical protein
MERLAINKRFKKIISFRGYKIDIACSDRLWFIKDHKGVMHHVNFAIISSVFNGKEITSFMLSGLRVSIYK